MSKEMVLAFVPSVLADRRRFRQVGPYTAYEEGTGFILFYARRESLDEPHSGITTRARRMPRRAFSHTPASPIFALPAL
jgi:hypothetical protein